MKTGLSVVIPAYNEEANIAACLTNVYGVLKSLPLDWEIIVVNDGSRDRTGAIAGKMAKSIPHLKIVENKPNRGYGGSLKAGFAAATKEFIAFAHADNQFDFSEVTRLLALQRETNADIVSGIRPRGGHDPWHRLLVRWAWNTGLRALFGYLASDIDCGFKLIRRKILDRISLPSDGAMLDTQLLAGARARGMKVAELEVRHLPRTAGKSTGGNFRVWLKAWRELAFFWWQLRREILVEKGLAVFRWEAILILFVLVLGASLRLYKINEYLTFLGDEGRDAIVMRDIVLGRHFPAIGPGTSIGSMYLGPLYYYLIAPSLYLARLSPVGPAVEVALFGIATIGLLWWVGRQWFGRIPALAVSLLYSVSPVVIFYSRSSWNPNIMPFFALLTMYAVWKVWRFGYWRWLIIAAVGFAFVLQSHYLGLLLAPVIGLYWFLAACRHPARISRYTLLSLGIFLGLMFPLFWFDFRHHWTNLAALAKFLSERQTTVNFKIYKAFPNLWPIWTGISSSLLAAKIPALAAVLSGLTAVVYPLITVFGRRRLDRKYPDFIFVFLWLVVGVIGLGLYKQHIYDHYFGFLFSAVFLAFGFLLRFIHEILPVRTVSLVLALLFSGLVLANLRHSPLLSSPNQQLSRTREVTEFILRESAGRPFNLALLSKSNYDASYRYFFYLESAPLFTIHDRLTDQLFVICEDPDCSPVGHPLWEIAAFGWAKIDKQWEFPWHVKLYRLIPNPTGAHES